MRCSDALYTQRLKYTAITSRNHKPPAFPSNCTLCKKTLHRVTGKTKVHWAQTQSLSLRMLSETTVFIGPLETFWNLAQFLSKSICSFQSVHSPCCQVWQFGFAFWKRTRLFWNFSDKFVVHLLKAVLWEWKNLLCLPSLYYSLLDTSASLVPFQIDPCRLLMFCWTKQNSVFSLVPLGTVSHYL